jgi:hypothetical protein
MRGGTRCGQPARQDGVADRSECAVASSVQDVENAIGVTLAEYSRDAEVRADTAPVEPTGPQPGRRTDVGCSWVKAC